MSVRMRIQTSGTAIRSVIDTLEMAKKIGANSIHCEEGFALSEFGREAKEAGFPLRVYTVNDETRSGLLNNAGVEVIMTDFPERFL